MRELSRHFYFTRSLFFDTISFSFQYDFVCEDGYTKEGNDVATIVTIDYGACCGLMEPDALEVTEIN